MAIGDDGVLGGMPLVPGTADADTLDTIINLVQDYIANGPAKWKPGVVVPLSRFTDTVPITQGGTGATTAAAARAALEVAAESITVQSNGAYDIGLVWNGSQLQLFINGVFAGFLGGTPDLSNYVQKTGDTMSGQLFLPASFGAVSSYTVAYINGDGRVSRGTSSSRYKQDITRDCLLPDLFRVPFASYALRADPDKHIRYGYIAEDLAKDADTEPFVIYDDEGRPESYDMIGLLLAKVESLHRRVKELEDAGTH